MATENRKAITVGIFLSLGLLIFILGVFTLGGQQKNFAKSIKLDAVFDDVAGLKKGNDVWFSGVKVGNITSIKFVGTSEVRVEMKVDQSTQQYIHSNSGVKIGSDGLIGNKIIIIDGGSPQAPMVEDGAQLHAEKLLSTDDILKTLQQNNQNLLSITGDFKTLSHQILQGKGTVGTLLADSAMGLQLRKSMQNLQTATQSAARLASELDRFSNKMNTKGGLADKVLTDTVVYSHLQASVAQLQQAAANVISFTDNLSKMSSKLNSKDNAVGVLLNDPKAAAQVQNAITNLQQSSIKLNDDLEAVQHNFLLKGFFKKREKARQDSLKKR